MCEQTSEKKAAGTELRMNWKKIKKKNWHNKKLQATGMLRSAIQLMNIIYWRQWTVDVCDSYKAASAVTLA